MSFFAKISDQSIGGTYMTLLNTVFNVAGLLPNQAVLFLVNEVSLFGVDGFYILNIVSVIYGFYWYFAFSDNFVRLETLEPSKWSVDYKQ